MSQPKLLPNGNSHSDLHDNPLLHPRSIQPLTDDLFQEPTAEYRGSPFWAWNNRLSLPTLVDQIDTFSQMGFGGFHMHSRVGLDTPYMAPEFMDCVKGCIESAKERGMLAYLYDEDRWPSGAAGGLVTKGRPDLGARHLLLTTKRYGEMEDPSSSQSTLGSAIRSEDGHLIAKYVLRPDSTSSTLYLFERLKIDDTASANEGETIWYAYLEGNPPSEWYNGQTYVDTLNTAAIQRFIQLTHERYKEAVGTEFGKTVPSIFCDEPQFSHKAQLISSNQQKDLFFPWSNDLCDTFQSQYGYDILDTLPQVVWDTPVTPDASHPSLTRYHYHEHVCERFVSAFMDQLSTWCRSNGIALTGHMMQEPTLRSQTETLGEAMRCYRNLDVPGIDILHDAYEPNTVKQAVSVSRQRNGQRGRAMSELYGVTNWTFDFTGYKGQGDWQAALGITLRVPHLSPVTLAGEGKRDYPAAIGYQAGWHKQWSVLEDHFARVNIALTRGKAVTRVAVLHPIESFWLCFGPLDRNQDEQIWRLETFDQLTEWLLGGLVDFDFVSESLWPDQTPLDSIVDNQLPVGQCVYDAIIVPNMRTLRESSLKRLQRFAHVGGKVIIAGMEPELVDAKRPNVTPTIPGAVKVGFTRYEVLSAVSQLRDVDITEHWGTRTESLLYQLRIDSNSDQFLFICNTNREKQLDTMVKVKGSYQAQVLDTMTGAQWYVETKQKHGWTSWPWVFEGAASLLVRLSSGDQSIHSGAPQTVYSKEYGTIAHLHLDRVELGEPNVLLLDKAEWRLNNDSDWHAMEEVLRLDNKARSILSMPMRTEKYRQPWSMPDDERSTKNTLHLRYNVTVQGDIPGPIHLALENRSGTVISLNGQVVGAEEDGWWVDKEITTVPIINTGGVLTSGRHKIELAIEYGLLTNVERIYLLGNFSVKLRADQATLMPFDSDVSFGDITCQGLPFYAGSIIYHTTFTLDSAQNIAIDVPNYKGPLVTARLDDDSCMKPVFGHPAYALFEDVKAGSHTLSLELFGNRENSFGTVHLPSGKTKWHGPNAWRYEHDWWCEEYNVKPFGIIEAPRVKVQGSEDKVTIRRSKVQKWYN